MIEQFYLTHKWKLIGTMKPDQSGNEGVIYIPQISKTGVPTSDAVLCHFLDNSLMWRNVHNKVGHNWVIYSLL